MSYRDVVETYYDPFSVPTVDFFDNIDKRFDVSW